MDKVDERIRDGTLILVAEEYDGQAGHKLHTPNIQAHLVSIATGRRRISVVGVCRSPGSMRFQVGELFPLLIVVAGSTGKLLIPGDFNAPDTDWVCETVLKGVMVQHVIQATRWRFGKYLQPLTWFLREH